MAALSFGGPAGQIAVMHRIIVDEKKWIGEERLRDNRLLGSALSAVTATVVGVILNLAVWFCLHTLFAQVDTWQYGNLLMTAPLMGRRRRLLSATVAVDRRRRRLLQG